MSVCGVDLFLGKLSMSLRSKTDLAGSRMNTFEHMAAAGGAKCFGPDKQNHSDRRDLTFDIIVPC
jgi:hypothetical protein